MLAVVSASRASIDAGALAYRVATTWRDGAGRSVLVDADNTGSALSERLGEATRHVFSPLESGLPSLIAARSGLTLRLLAQHCYNLDSEDGSLWLLFGPHHPEGAGHAAGWLAERLDDLAEIHRRRPVLVAASLKRPDRRLASLLAGLSGAAVVAPVPDDKALIELRRELREWRLAGSPRGPWTGLVVEGDLAFKDEEVAEYLGVEMLGRLAAIDDAKLLRGPAGLRGWSARHAVAAVAGRMLEAASRLDGSVTPAPAADGGGGTRADVA